MIPEAWEQYEKQPKTILAYTQSLDYAEEKLANIVYVLESAKSELLRERRDYFTDLASRVRVLRHECKRESERMGKWSLAYFNRNVHNTILLRNVPPVSEFFKGD